MTLLAAYLSGVVPALGWTLAHFLWQGALVAVLLGLLLKTCRTAQARYNLALGALVLMAALPVVTFAWLQGDVRVVFAPAGFPGLAAGRALTWEKVAVSVWLTGVVVLAVRTAGGLWLIEHMRRGSTPLPPVWASRCGLLQQRMAGSLKVVFAQSQAVAAPLVAGWLKPMVLIPTAALTRMPVDQLEALILHELAHVRRLDAFANLVQAVVETALFYHPAVWWVSRRIRVEREHCCDDLAVAAVQDPALYVRALQSLEALRPAPAAALASNGGDLKLRAARILGLASAPERPALSRVAAVLILTLAAAAVTHSAAVKAEPASPARLAKAVAATSAPAPALAVAPEPDQVPAAKTVVLARNDAVLGPNLAIAGTGPGPLALARTLAAPPIEAAVASAPAPDVQATKPSDPVDAAMRFVQTYAATVGKHAVIARWDTRICLNVVGLAHDQEAAVQARVAEVAKAVGAVTAEARNCSGANVEIGFSTNPQRMLDDVTARRPTLLSDKSNGVTADRTVTHPIQAWYRTNGEVGPNPLPIDCRNGYGGGPTPDCGPFPQFTNVLVIVDMRRTDGKGLALLTDYAAMLALSQPRSLDRCNALPSITDLFAACPGQASSAGLTEADIAYLTALYSDKAGNVSPGARGAFASPYNTPKVLPGRDLSVTQSDIAERMAQLLTNPKLAASPAAAAAPPASPTPTAPSKQAASFVQTYAAATAKNEAIARWSQPICVQVGGLANDQAAAVKARIEAVAMDIGAKVQPAGCNPNISIGFAADPQTVLDRVIKSDSRLLEDSSSGVTPAKTVTLPIQAWYLTNGTDVATNDAGEFKALADYRRNGPPGLMTPVLYQASPPISGRDQYYPGGYFGDQFGGLPPDVEPRAPRSTTDTSRQFLNAFVVVDAKRISHAKLSAISDYAAMLALSQPKSLGQCQALPSITDLFAACSGRAAPEGLTSADLAYLRALYSADHTIWAKGRSARAADVAKAMAQLLSTGKLAAPATGADLKKDALAFVKTVSPPGRYTVGRWTRPICVRVIGLDAHQQEALIGVVEGLATQLGIGTQGAGCQTANVEIAFTPDPQGMVNAAAKSGLLAGVANRTATHAIQAWYATNGVDGEPMAGDIGGVETRALGNALVIVDLSKTSGMNLRPLADYAAMLALSEHGSDERCGVLPSVLDLFAGPCSGRGAPEGVTEADGAYLQALYQWDDKGIAPSNASAVAGRMADVLNGAKPPPPGPRPEIPALAHAPHGGAVAGGSL